MSRIHHHRFDWQRGQEPGRRIRNRIVRSPKIFRKRVSPLLEWARPEDFRARYRLYHEQVRELADRFARSPSYRGDPLSLSGGAIPPENRVCIALRYLGTGADFKTIGDNHGVSRATTQRCVSEFVEFMVSHVNDYVKMPETPEEVALLSADFDRLEGFQGVIGCVDGTHIPIRRPTVDEQSFVNRHGYHSLNVMVVCDAHARIIFVEPNFKGSQNDQMVWRECNLGQTIRDTGYTGDFFFLGDGGYAINQHMLIPFTITERLSRAERRYQEKHTSVRSLVERVFGQLKNRWRCVGKQGGGVIMRDPIDATHIIVACCALHNLATEGRMERDDHQRVGLPQRPVMALEIPAGNVGENSHQLGLRKRDAVIHRLFGGPNVRRAAALRLQKAERRRQQRRLERLDQ